MHLKVSCATFVDRLHFIVLKGLFGAFHRVCVVSSVILLTTINESKVFLNVSFTGGFGNLYMISCYKKAIKEGCAGLITGFAVAKADEFATNLVGLSFN